MNDSSMIEKAAHRPPLVTTVGVLGVVAGAFPLIEFAAVLLSRNFSAWFIPLFRSMVPVGPAVMLGLLLGIGATDTVFGVGVLAGKRWAAAGMILRSVFTVPFDYINFRAGNLGGALFGLTVCVFIVWALLRYKSRAWFHKRENLIL